MSDPVEYSVQVQHWQDGQIAIRVLDVGDSDEDRRSVAFMLRAAADMVEGYGVRDPAKLYS